jgi:hypothetical protein
MSYTDQLGRTEHELARLDHMTVQNQSQLDAYEASVRQARDALVQLQAKSDEARRQLREMGDEIRPTATALSPYSATAFSSSSDSDEQQRLVVPTVAGLTFLAATRAFLQDRAAVRRQNDAAAVARANANISNRRTSEDYDDNGGDDNGGLYGGPSDASTAKTFASAADSAGRGGGGVWVKPPGVGGGRGVGVSVRLVVVFAVAHSFSDRNPRSFPLRLLLKCARDKHICMYVYMHKNSPTWPLVDWRLFWVLPPSPVRARVRRKHHHNHCNNNRCQHPPRWSILMILCDCRHLFPPPPLNRQRRLEAYPRS